MITDLKQNPTSEQGAQIALWIRRDPVHAAEVLFGVQLWREQRRILRAVFSHRRVTVKTCHKAGKSFVAAIAVILWALAYPRQCKITTTAPGQVQVYQILWSTIRMLWQRAYERGWKLGAEPSKGQWELGPDWFAQGFKPSDYREDHFQGFNSRHSLVVVDEASGVSTNILAGARGITSNDGSTLMLIGNAINGASDFARTFSLSGYAKITVSAFDTPNFTATNITREMVEAGAVDVLNLPPMPETHLIGPAYAVEALEDGGPPATNAAYQSRVLAEFPAHSEDVLIPYDWVRAAMNRYGEIDPSDSDPRILSYDVARSPTGDESVLGFRHGHRFRVHKTGQGWHTAEGAANARDAAIALGVTGFRMDHLGNGTGPYDLLTGWHEEGSLLVPPQGFAAGGSAIDKERFVSLRAEAWWRLRVLLDPNSGSAGMPIELAPDKKLEAQLSTIKRPRRQRDGKIVVEGKPDMKARGLPSPDRGDACMMAFAIMPEPEREPWSGFA